MGKRVRCADTAPLTTNGHYVRASRAQEARHPRHDLPEVAAALQAAFAAPTGLMAGAESVGDPIAVLPVPE